MIKPSSKRNDYWPHDLPAYWRSYGHSVAWEDLIDFKERSYDGKYVVVAWDAGDGRIGVADIACGDAWEMQNDSEEMSTKQWKGLKIVPECDWYRIPDEDGEDE